MPNKRKLQKGWHSGPPPSKGWWPASADFNDKYVRYWDGKSWSVALYEGMSMRNVEFWSGVKVGIKNPDIYWKHRPNDWPERSKT